MTPEHWNNELHCEFKSYKLHEESFYSIIISCFHNSGHQLSYWSATLAFFKLKQFEDRLQNRLEKYLSDLKQHRIRNPDFESSSSKNTAAYVSHNAVQFSFLN